MSVATAQVLGCFFKHQHALRTAFTGGHGGRVSRWAVVDDLPLDAKGTKVRSDDPVSASLATVTEAVRDAWQRRWDAVVAPVTGCADYEVFRARIAEMTRS